MKDEIKVIKLMQQEAGKVDSIHSEIGVAKGVRRR